MEKQPETAEYHLQELMKYIKQLEDEKAKSKKRVRQLEETSELKDLFTDIIRHDLLNPLGIIKNVFDALPDSPEIQPLKSMINRNIQRAIEITENTSKLAKLERPEQLVYESKDLNSIFKKIVRDFDHSLKEKNMKLEYRAKDKYYAYVDPCIENVFSNLLSNAIKYSPEKSKVVVDIEDLDTSYKIKVEDNGEGVPDEYKESIFTRFERRTMGGVKGSGLGLSIVKRVVELHNGKVWVEDNSEGGSIFYVQLPKYRQR